MSARERVTDVSRSKALAR